MHFPPGTTGALCSEHPSKQPGTKGDLCRNDVGALTHAVCLPASVWSSLALGSDPFHIGKTEATGCVDALTAPSAGGDGILFAKALHLRDNRGERFKKRGEKRGRRGEREEEEREEEGKKEGGGGRREARGGRRGGGGEEEEEGKE